MVFVITKLAWQIIIRNTEPTHVNMHHLSFMCHLVLYVISVAVVFTFNVTVLSWIDDRNYPYFTYKFHIISRV